MRSLILLLTTTILAIANANPSLIYSRQDYKVYKDSQPANGMSAAGPSQSPAPALETKSFNTLPVGSLSVNWVRSLPVPIPTESKKNFFPMLFDWFVRIPVNSLTQPVVGRKIMSEAKTYHVPVKSPTDAVESLPVLDPFLSSLKKVTVTLVVTVHDCVPTSSFKEYGDYGIQLGLVTTGIFGTKYIKPPVMSCETLNTYSVNDRESTKGANGMITGKEWRVEMKMPDQKNPPYIYAEIAQGSQPQGNLLKKKMWQSLRVQPSQTRLIDKISPVVALVSEYQYRIDDQTSRAAYADKMDERWHKYTQQGEGIQQQVGEQISPRPFYKKGLTVAEMKNNQAKILQEMDSCAIRITSTYGLHEVPSWNEPPYARQGSVRSRISSTEPRGQPDNPNRGCFPFFKCYERGNRRPVEASMSGRSSSLGTGEAPPPDQNQQGQEQQGGSQDMGPGDQSGSGPLSRSDSRRFHPKPK